MDRLAVAPLVIALLLLPSLALAAPADEPGNSNEDGKSMEIALTVRSGVTGNYSSASPNFYGIGALAEPMIVFNDLLAAGLRVDAMALFGLNLGDDVQAGLRLLGGVLPKVEYRVFRGAIQPVIGLAGGLYAVGITGASVSNDNEDVGALAGGGQVPGFAPQVGINLGGFRIAVLSHFLLGPNIEPIFALELSGNTFQLKF
jgi:hypothetical protein